MPIRLSDLSPQARQQALEQLGVRKAVRTPATFHEPLPMTERQVEVLTRRHAIARIASMITADPQRIEWAVQALIVEIEALRTMTAPQPPGSPQSEQLVLG